MASVLRVSKDQLTVTISIAIKDDVDMIETNMSGYGYSCIESTESGEDYGPGRLVLESYNPVDKETARYHLEHACTLARQEAERAAR